MSFRIPKEFFFWKFAKIPDFQPINCGSMRRRRRLRTANMEQKEEENGHFLLEDDGDDDESDYGRHCWPPSFCRDTVGGGLRYGIYKFPADQCPLRSLYMSTQIQPSPPPPLKMPCFSNFRPWKSHSRPSRNSQKCHHFSLFLGWHQKFLPNFSYFPDHQNHPPMDWSAGWRGLTNPFCA